VKSAPSRGFFPRFLPYRERRKNMEHESKREKKMRIFAWEVRKERDKRFGFFKVYELAHKSRKICNT
jgi:hypothetical protein